MSARIARAEGFAWLEQRLDQWAQWKRGGMLAGLGYGSLLGRYSKRDVTTGPAIEHDNPAFDRMMGELDRAVLELPPQFLQVVRLKHDHHNPDDALPPSEMARVCNVSTSTVYYRLKLAYRLLAERLREG